MGWNSKWRAQQVQKRRVSEVHNCHWIEVQLDYFDCREFRWNDVVWNAQWPERAFERALADLFQSRRITTRNSKLPFAGFKWHAVGRNRKWRSVHPFGNDSSSARGAGIVARTNLWNCGRQDRLAVDRNGESCSTCES